MEPPGTEGRSTSAVGMLAVRKYQQGLELHRPASDVGWDQDGMEVVEGGRPTRGPVPREAQNQKQRMKDLKEPGYLTIGWGPQAFPSGEGRGGGGPQIGRT